MELLLASATSVSTGVTILFAVLLVGLILSLALEEKIHAKKSIIAGAFAIVSLLLSAICGVLPFERTVVGSHRVADHDAFDADVVYEPAGELEQVHVDEVESPADPAHEEAGAKNADDPAHRHLHIDGHRIAMPVFIPGIDWGVIAIILGSSLFVDVTSRSGLFTWIAIKVTKASRGDPMWLLYSYGIMTVVFSAVLNNVTAMIIVGSLTAVSLDKLGRRDKLLAFLLIEGLLTNIGGLLTLISSVPNIIVGTAAQISFVEFFLKASPYVVVATVVSLALGARFFGIRRLTLASEKQEARELVASFNENDGVESWGFFWFAASMLILFILTIATTSVLPYIQHLDMGFVALAFAGIMLLRYKSEVDSFYKAVDWDLLGFFMALFVVIYVMEHAQVLASIGHGLELVLNQITAPRAGFADATILLVGAAGFSSVTDNIPLAAMLANILTTLGGSQLIRVMVVHYFGANLGGNLTPIGSASTLVAVTIMHKHHLPMSFMGFVRKAAPFALLHILLAVLYVLLFLRGPVPA